MSSAFLRPHFGHHFVEAGQRLTCLGSSLEGILESGRKEGISAARERMELRQDSDQSSILIFGNMGLQRRGRGPFLPNHLRSPAAGDHVNTLARRQVVAVGVAER